MTTGHVQRSSGKFHFHKKPFWTGIPEPGEEQLAKTNAAHSQGGVNQLERFEARKFNALPLDDLHLAACHRQPAWIRKHCRNRLLWHHLLNPDHPNLWADAECDLP